MSIPLGLITYDSHVTAWMTNPERKFTDRDGKVCDRTTAGLLYRKHVHIASAIVEHVGRGTLRSDQGAATEADLNPNRLLSYGMRHDRIWDELVLPTIQGIGPAVFARLLDVEKSTVSRWLNRTRRPWESSRRKVLACIKKELRSMDFSPSRNVNVLMVEFLETRPDLR